MDQHLRQSNFVGPRRKPSPSSRNRKSFFYIPKFIPQLPKIQSERGSALVMAAIFMIVATFLITTGMRLISDASKEAKQRELFVGEAENVARAGLVDAIGWFRRQSGNGGVVSGYTQNNVTPQQIPIATVVPGLANVDQAFHPVFDALNPQASDTSDEAIGLVEDYPLDSPITATAVLWARYEIKRQGAGAYDPTAVHDISGERTDYVNGDGLVWNIVATGYVYRRMDKTVDANGNFLVSYSTPPNQLLATAVFSTELRKLSLIMPIPSYAGDISAGVYVQNMKTQVTLTNSDTLLNGAVSAIGSYAAIGETAP